MGFLNIFKRKKSRQKITRDQMLHLSRQFDSAKFDNIFAGWTGTSAAPDEELKGALPTIRARARSLCQNSEYAKKFITLTKANVIGPRGFKFQAKTRNAQGDLISSIITIWNVCFSSGRKILIMSQSMVARTG